MKLILATLLALAFSSTHAQTIPLSINGAAKCAAARTGDSFTGVVDRACQNVPPPVDNGALLRGNVTYQDGGTVPNVDLTQMRNVYGRASASETPKDWAFASGSRPKIQLPIGKHLNMAFAFDQDATGTTGSISGSQYGSTNRAVYVQVFENGLPIFYRDHDSRNRPLLFNEQPWIYLVRNQPRTELKCPVRAGATYQVIVGYLDQRGGTMVTQWQGN